MAEETMQTNQARPGLYVGVWCALLILTAATVAVSRLQIVSFAALVSVGIASVKSFLVLTFFMHLKHEPPILKVMLVIAVAALALIILLTFTDVWYRWGAHAHP